MLAGGTGVRESKPAEGTGDVAWRVPRFRSIRGILRANPALRMTAQGKADRAKIRHNANREIGVPRGQRPARGRFESLVGLGKDGLFFGWLAAIDAIA